MFDELQETHGGGARGPSKKMLKHKTEQDAKCSFRPAINKKSAKMVSNARQMFAGDGGLRDS